MVDNAQHLLEYRLAKIFQQAYPQASISNFGNGCRINEKKKLKNKVKNLKKFQQENGNI